MVMSSGAISNTQATQAKQDCTGLTDDLEDGCWKAGNRCRERPQCVAM
jgi:hypothetical protein